MTQRASTGDRQTHDYVRGNPNGRLTLVEYADFECPYCGMAFPYVKRAAERFKNDLAEIFRPFPLIQIHPHALHAAQAAEAAGLQGKFWQMHDTLFEHQQRLADSDLLDYARRIGLDVDRFERDFSSSAVNDAIQRSLQEGAAQGVEGTPTFFLNGEQLNLSRFEDIEEIIAKALAASSS
jgi:protein-disulfide isomerase